MYESRCARAHGVGGGAGGGVGGKGGGGVPWAGQRDGSYTFPLSLSSMQRRLIDASVLLLSLNTHKVCPWGR
jgi:hypothetical protein